jgi:hypothetical protein
MTSSFSLPGGHQVKLFRAIRATRSKASATDPSYVEAGGQVATRWIPIHDPSSPEPVTADPPTRPADYVGQIIAVPAVRVDSAS